MFDTILGYLNIKSNIRIRIISKICGNGERSVFIAKYKNKKIILKKIIKNSKTTKIAHNEIKILKHLNHHQIIKYIGYCETDNYISIITQYCKGNNLVDALNSNKLTRSEDNCKMIVYNILKILLYLKECHICHRDIKLENIIYNPKNKKITLCDFGLATFIDDNTMLSTICGTPYYIAPEIFQKRNYNEKVDIWSLGILICIFLFNNKPFQGNNLNELQKNIIETKPQIDYEKWKKISSNLKDLISRMLEKDPDKRPNVKQLLKHPWLT